MKCRINRLIPDGNGHFLLELAVRDDIRSKVDELLGKDLECEIKPVRGKKRSLDANAYCWVLLDKLSEKLKIPKIDLYRHYIPLVGETSDLYKLPIIAVDDFEQAWCKDKLGRMIERLPVYEADYQTIIVYFSSSDFDTRQMSRFLDLIIEDCKEQGIETMTPEEINKMKDLWR